MRQRTIMMTLIVFLALSGLSLARPPYHVTPMVVTGSLNGVRFETTIVVKPGAYEIDLFGHPTCSLSLNAAGADGEAFPNPALIQFAHSPIPNVYIDFDPDERPTGPVYVTRTAPKDTVQFGLGVLRCSIDPLALDEPMDYMHSYATYSSYDIESGLKIAEATVFGGKPTALAYLLADQSDGSRLAIAIANPAHNDTYELEIKVIDDAHRSTIVEVPNNSVRTFFLDEVLDVAETGVTLVEMTVLARTWSSTTGPRRQEPCVPDIVTDCLFSAIGLRFDGGVYSTVPILP